MPRIIWNIGRHAKTEKAGSAQSDRNRIPNELGTSQIQTMRETWSDEGTVPDIIFHSGVLRTEIPAKAIKGNGDAELMSVPVMYSPDSTSADPTEQIEAAVIWTADPHFGYNLASWYSNHLTRECAIRRSREAKASIMEALKRYESKEEIVVGVIGHFFFLNELAAQIASPKRKPSLVKKCREFEFAECGRICLLQTPEKGVIKSAFLTPGEKLPTGWSS